MCGEVKKGSITPLVFLTSGPGGMCGEVEKGSFTPLVFLTSGGMCDEVEKEASHR